MSSPSCILLILMIMHDGTFLLIKKGCVGGKARKSKSVPGREPGNDLSPGQPSGQWWREPGAVWGHSVLEWNLGSGTVLGEVSWHPQALRPWLQQEGAVPTLQELPCVLGMWMRRGSDPGGQAGCLTDPGSLSSGARALRRVEFHPSRRLLRTNTF